MVAKAFDVNLKKKRILFATTVLPSKRRTGGEIVSDTFIERLRLLGHQIDVAGYVRPGDAKSAQVSDLLLGERPIETESAGRAQAVKWIVSALLRGWPYSGAKYFSSHYQSLIAHSSDYDLLIVDHAQLGFMLSKHISAKNLIHISHNLEQDLYRQQVATSGSKVKSMLLRRESEKMQTVERNLATWARQVWCLTEADAEWFRSCNANTHVFAVPANPDIGMAFPAGSICRDIGMIGTWSWDANRKGLEWFFQFVYQLLPTDISIHVAGKGADWLMGRYSNVKCLGFVDCAAEFMATSRVLAVPSIEGGGIQIKTLDAIASARPVVSTSVAVRGISAIPDSVVTADTPEEFAHRLEVLLKSIEDPEKSLRAMQWISLRNQAFNTQLLKCIEML